MKVKFFYDEITELYNEAIDMINGVKPIEDTELNGSTWYIYAMLAIREINNIVYGYDKPIYDPEGEIVDNTSSPYWTEPEHVAAQGPYEYGYVKHLQLLAKVLHSKGINHGEYDQIEKLYDRARAAEIVVQEVKGIIGRAYSTFSELADNPDAMRGEKDKGLKLYQFFGYESIRKSYEGELWFDDLTQDIFKLEKADSFGEYKKEADRKYAQANPSYFDGVDVLAEFMANNEKEK